LIAFIDSGLLEVNRKPLIVNLYCRRWLSWSLRARHY
jgi:hypothetical protein